MAAFILQPPDETVDLLGQRVDARDIVDELGHARVIQRVADARDVELGKMAFGHAALSPGGQRAVFQSCAEADAQSKA